MSFPLVKLVVECCVNAIMQTILQLINSYYIGKESSKVHKCKLYEQGKILCLSQVTLYDTKTDSFHCK